MVVGSIPSLAPIVLIESLPDPKTGKIRCRALVIRWDPKMSDWTIKTSNSIRYHRQSLLQCFKQAILQNGGLPFMYNHVLEGEHADQLGSIDNVIDTSEGMIIEGTLNPAKDRVQDEIMPGYLKNVSLQVIAYDYWKENERDGMGETTFTKPQRALEVSFVPVNGAFGGKLLDLAIAESFSLNPKATRSQELPSYSKDQFVETIVSKAASFDEIVQLFTEQFQFKVGDVVHGPAGTGKVMYFRGDSVGILLTDSNQHVEVPAKEYMKESFNDEVDTLAREKYGVPFHMLNKEQQTELILLVKNRKKEQAPSATMLRGADYEKPAPYRGYAKEFDDFYDDLLKKVDATNEKELREAWVSSGDKGNDEIKTRLAFMLRMSDAPQMAEEVREATTKEDMERVAKKIRALAMSAMKKGATEEEVMRGIDNLDEMLHQWKESMESIDSMPGGKADDMPDDAFDAEQLAAGIKVEMEHTNDAEHAKEIAKDHLVEDKDYYKKLAKIHKEVQGKLLSISKMTREEKEKAFNAAKPWADALHPLKDMSDVELDAELLKLGYMESVKR